MNRMRIRKFMQGWILITRVADPYSFDSDTGKGPDPAFLAEYRSGSRGFDTKNWKNLQLKKIYFLFFYQ